MKLLGPIEDRLDSAVRMGVLDGDEYERHVLGRQIQEAVEEFATLRARIAELERLLEETVEALIWCSGSADFGEGGKAEEGWKKLCEPFIRRALKGKP